MLTYRSTSTKTGRYYIGSALTYCHYMNRVGNHHMRREVNDFQRDLQSDPRSFVWEILREDDLAERTYEYELLQKNVGDPLCYNKSKSNGSGFGGRPEGYTHTDITKLKMSESALRPEAQPEHKKQAQSKAVTATNSKLQPCPDCGKLMNVGNLTQHIRRQTCKRK